MEPLWALFQPYHLARVPTPPPLPLFTGTLVFALQWLTGCVLAALVCWWLARWVKRRRLGRRPANQRTLFVAFLLLALGAANIFIEGRAYLPHTPVYAIAVQVLFLLYFYVFSDNRYAPRWSRWLGIFYAIGLLFTMIPGGTSNSNQSNDAQAVAVFAVIHQIPGVVGLFAALGNMFALWLTIIGIVPQLYLHYRHLSTAPERERVGRSGWAAAIAALLLGGFVLLALSGLFALTSGSDQFAQVGAGVPTHPPISLVLYAQAGFFLLAGLLPLAAAFAVLRPRGYDRDALANRALVYGALSLGELLIYILAIGAVYALRFLNPGLAQIAPYASIPFFVLIALVMAAAFRSLREQIQPRIDQRFFPRRFEATRTFAAWSPTLREDARLDQMGVRLTEVVEHALRPAGVVLWLRPLAGMPGPRATGMALPPLGPGNTLIADAQAAILAGQRTQESPDTLALRRQATTLPAGAPSASGAALAPALTIAGDDPLHAVCLRSATALPVDRLPATSPAADDLRRASMCLLVPLLSQGELAGLLTLGAPVDGRPYTSDECELLEQVANEAAPALRAAQVAQVHEVEMRGRERLEQEMQTARRIQESLLPKSVPLLAGWKLAAYYQPAREVGGDFYDFVPLSDGRLAIILGDVTDKGVPAALVMATTRSMLRAAAQSTTRQVAAPGDVLARVNDLLYADLPASMFVTCFYAILDPATGTLRFANAGQDVPYLRQADHDVAELRETGMPLGLMPNMRYEEHETLLSPGACVVFYSDGLVEAHNPDGQMFSFGRLMEVIGRHPGNLKLVEVLLDELAEFTGPGWEQEDDVTLVVLQRTSDEQAGVGIAAIGAAGASTAFAAGDDLDGVGSAAQGGDEVSWHTLDAFEVPSEPGNERQVIARVERAVSALALPTPRLEDLKTAVSEAALNAMEHGNHFRAELPVVVQVLASPEALLVRITDEGGSQPIPEGATPDLRAKLAEQQSPRGWGLFLIKHLVDEMRISGDATHHTVELVLRRDSAPATEDEPAPSER